MPPGSKKRKAAKKKQQQQASSTQTNLISTNHESREEDAVKFEKELGLDTTDERTEITDSSHGHDKNSSSSSSSSSSSNSDDESSEVKKKETGESVSEAITVSSVPNQPIPIAGDAPFMGSTANVIVESIGLMDSTTPSDPNTEKVIEIAPVDTIIPTENEESSLPKPNEITAQVPLASDEVKQASSSATTDVKKETEGKTSTLVPESSNVSGVTIPHEEEAPVRPTHGVAQRTSWLSCCGLFDVVTGSSR